MPSKLTTSEFVLKSQAKHCPIRYDYRNVVYVNSRVPVCIDCPVHGQFMQKPNNHLNGARCPECAKISRASFFRSNTKIFIEKANIRHDGRYNYFKTQYGKNNLDEVIIICPLHGEFVQTPNDHLDGCGCPTCGKEISVRSRTKTTSEFIRDARNVWNDLYDYSHTKYFNCDEKVIITCKKHGDFLQTPNNHINCEQGCPKCNMSKGEAKILIYLQSHNFDYVQQQWFTDCRSGKGKRQVLKFDFYLPSQNLLIEYNGKQHYKSNSFVGGRHLTTDDELALIQNNDEIKKKYAISKKIDLLIIKYTNINQIEKILSAKLNKNKNKG